MHSEHQRRARRFHFRHEKALLVGHDTIGRVNVERQFFSIVRALETVHQPNSTFFSDFFQHNQTRQCGTSIFQHCSYPGDCSPAE